MAIFFTFFILSVPLIIISWRSLSNTKSHGFYRFFAWECVLLLMVINFQFWFDDPTRPHQIISWIILLYSLYLLIAGVIQMKKFGKSDEARMEKELFQFEKTSRLVQSGIFKYIRHPLYSSLLFLAWGAYFKNTSLVAFILSLLSTAFLVITAIMDEKECLGYFGDKYRDYMKGTKRFVPFLI